MSDEATKVEEQNGEASEEDEPQARIEAIEAELARLQQRRRELEEEIEGAATALGHAQEGLIEGEEGAGDEAQRLQALITSRKDTIAVLDEKAAGVEKRLEKARAALSVEEHKRDMVRLSKEAAKAKARYEEAYDELAAAVKEKLAVLESHQGAWSQAADDFQERHDALEEQGHSSDALLEELESRGATLEPIREKATRWSNLPIYRYAHPLVETTDGNPSGKIISTVRQWLSNRQIGREQSARLRA